MRRSLQEPQLHCPALIALTMPGAVKVPASVRSPLPTCCRLPYSSRVFCPPSALPRSSLPPSLSPRSLAQIGSTGPAQGVCSPHPILGSLEMSLGLPWYLLEREGTDVPLLSCQQHFFPTLFSVLPEAELGGRTTLPCPNIRQES